MTTNARMDFRLPESEKAVIEQAASLAGVSSSAFIRNVAGEAARQRLHEARILRLDASASRDFMDALERPFAPNAALRRAMQRAEELGL